MVQASDAVLTAQADLEGGPAIDRKEIARALQAELKRVGCYPGAIDGAWGPGSQRALAAFNLHAGTRHETTTPAPAVIQDVRGHSKRVCPLTCEHGYKVDGERCVAIVCPTGETVGPGNVCVAIPKPPEERSRIRVCNRSGMKAEVAIMGRKDPNSSTQTVSGWYHFAPGECGWIGYYAKGSIYLMARAPSENRAWRGTDLKLCVAKEAFNRDRGSNYTCSGSEWLESFTEYKPYSDTWTWNLDP